MSILSAYTFYLVGKTCDITKTNSFADAWTASVSKSTTWMVQISTVIAPLIGCMSNFMILSEVLCLLLRSCGFSVSRDLLIISSVCVLLFPLCTMRDMSGLHVTSLLGILCQLFIVFVLLVRLLDGSYMTGGKYFHSANFLTTPLSYMPTPKSTSSNWCILASLLSYCFLCHYNAPRYHAELTRQSKEPSLFWKVCSTAYLISAVIYLVIINLTLRLFGSSVQRFSLATFSPKDFLATVAVLTFGFSVFATFPFQFLNVRQFFFELAGGRYSVHQISAIILMGIGLITLKFQDISRLATFSGALLGTTTMFIFPSIMFLRAQQTAHLCDQDLGEVNSTCLIRPWKIIPLQARYSSIAKHGLLVVCGAILSVVGFYNNLKEMLNK